MPFAKTQMDLEIVQLSELSQTIDIIWYRLYEEPKKNDINEFIYKIETDLKQTYDYQRGRIDWKFGIDRYTLLYFK